MIPTPLKERFCVKNQAGHSLISLVLTLAVLSFALIGALQTAHGRASAAESVVKSGSGDCLDVHLGQEVDGNPVDSWTCNSSSAQAWTIYADKLVHGANFCLSVAGDSTASGSKIVINSCSEAPGQVWLRDQAGFYNPNSGLCLSQPPPAAGSQLELASCNQLARPSETWQLSSGDQVVGCDRGTKGDRVACSAAKEWSIWQSGKVSHLYLLNKYTDQAPYEAWCADFVSYAYKEAGYPFKGGQTDGWDDNNANNIQTEGFNVHYPGSYIPKAGDVAYFSYDGGHVEIVASGGKVPTFIYGNSATLDPTTNNGQMEANTKTADGINGQLVYYLSPN